MEALSYKKEDLSEKRWKIVLNVILTCGFIALLSFGAYKCWKSIRLVSSGKETEAVCVRIEQVTRGSGKDRRQETKHYVRFTTSEEQTIEALIEPYLPRLKQGGTISVLYLPEQPTIAEANRFLSLWFPPALTLGLCSLLFFLILGLNKKRVDKAQS